MRIRSEAIIEIHDEGGTIALVVELRESAGKNPDRVAIPLDAGEDPAAVAKALAQVCDLAIDQHLMTVHLFRQRTDDIQRGKVEA